MTPPASELQRPRDEELDLFGLTHPGNTRPTNEDHFLVCTIHPQLVIHQTSLQETDKLPLRGSRLATILAVADGVGGGVFGSDAAQLATETIMTYVTSTVRCYQAAGSQSEAVLLDELRSACLQAHDSVRAEAVSRSEPARMATTLTMAVAIWPWFYAVQVGDSRAYWWDGSKLQLVTRDQTLAQGLADQGVLPPDRLETSPLRHVLASAIGGDEAIPVVTRVDMRRTGLILLCTDGLTKHVSDADIAAEIRRMESSEQLCQSLVDLALERGGSDNVTVVVGRAPLQK